MAKEKDVRYGTHCSLCSKKISFMEKNYTHILSDGTLCQKCHMTILQLLSQRDWWIDKKEYNQVMQANYSFRKEHCMPLEKARALFALRDKVCDTFLKTVELDDGNVFVVKDVFGMPKSPAIFILRAMKVKKKAVLQGFTLKGKVKKGDSIKLNIGGSVHSFTALDVVPAGTHPLEKETFYSELGTNIHNHTVSEDGDGWIIIDTEDYESITDSRFAAACGNSKG